MIVDTMIKLRGVTLTTTVGSGQSSPKTAKKNCGKHLPLNLYDIGQIFIQMSFFQ